MDRRGFLKALGVGSVAVVAAPKLLLPPPSTAVAVPERRIFLPPAGGWLPGPEQRLALGRNGQVLLYGPTHWEVTSDLMWPDPTLTAQMLLNEQVPVGDASGYLVAVSSSWDRPFRRVKYIGTGAPPSPQSLPNGSRLQVFRDVKDLYV